MTRRANFAPAGLLLATAMAGCFQSAPEPPGPVAGPGTPTHVVRRPTYPEPPEPARRPAARGEAGAADISWDTDRDRRFAEFLRDKSGGMIRKAAVGVDRKGLVQIELDKSVEPDDTLGLTKSVMAGARKDFPDQPIALKVFDPEGEPILSAHYRPGHGVSYQIAHARGAASERPATPPAESRRARADSSSDPLARSGVTESDQKFAAWAEDHGRPYLRYVQADLERHGRLWFGVTRDVKPADVPDLTKSLLEGAMKRFPQKRLTATVFDPEGERIGKAVLDSRDRIRWEQ